MKLFFTNVFIIMLLYLALLCVMVHTLVNGALSPDLMMSINVYYYYYIVKGHGQAHINYPLVMQALLYNPRPCYSDNNCNISIALFSLKIHARIKTISCEEIIDRSKHLSISFDTE